MMIGLAAPVYLVGLIHGNKPFDAYRIPATILMMSVVLLLTAISTGRRRIWFVSGFSAGAALGSLPVGLLYLVYTFMHFL